MQYKLEENSCLSLNLYVSSGNKEWSRIDLSLQLLSNIEIDKARQAQISNAGWLPTYGSINAGYNI